MSNLQVKNVLPLRTGLKDIETDRLSDNFCTREAHLTSNEYGRSLTKIILESIPKQENACHFGVSGWHNYDIAAVRESSFIIVGDINSNTILIHKKTMELLASSADRQEFVKKFSEWAENNSDKLEVNMQFSPSETILGEIEKELVREGSWLSTDSNFNYVKKMSKENRIVSMQLDITDRKSLKKISTLVKER